MCCHPAITLSCLCVRNEATTGGQFTKLDRPTGLLFIVCFASFSTDNWLVIYLYSSGLLLSILVWLFLCQWSHPDWYTVYPKKYAHGFVVLCFVVVMQSFIMNSHEVFIHIHQGCFAGTGAIVRLPQCQWSKPDGYGKISQCITTTKHSKAKTVCTFLGIYCRLK